MLARHGVSVDVVEGALTDIPTKSPHIVVSNNPNGILDGLIVGHILHTFRKGDFRILENHVFQKAADLDRNVLPIIFADGWIRLCELWSVSP